MSMRGIAILQAGFLLAAMSANAASVKDTVRITVLDSETRASAPDNNGVPQNCEQLTFDAYCRSTSNVPLVSTLLVQEGNDPPFRISCTMESKYSRCIPLPKGESFDAKKEKRGLEVYYVDDKGKVQKQLYSLVAANTNDTRPAPGVAGTTEPAPVPHSRTVPQSAPSPLPAPGAASSGVAVKPQEEKAAEKVKCNFTSSPAGADITVDGSYVGNTPSEITVSPGKHVVVFSLPGFSEWKRVLTVEVGSAVNVTASMQKMQP